MITAPVVIADVMPRALLELAGDAISGAYRTQAARYRYGPSTVKVDWALDGPIPWTAEAARQAGTVHVSGGEDEIIETIAQSQHQLPDRPYLLLGQQSLADPSRAPAGNHTAWAYTHGPQTVDWDRETHRHVDRIEAQIERFAPGFRDRILARSVLAPKDLEARNRNLIGGDVGWRKLRAQPGRLPADAEALALPHAGRGPVHRQRRHLPRRRGPRRPRGCRRPGRGARHR